MKNFISTTLLILAFAAASFAQLPTNPNCTKGHIDSPGAICTPPPQARAASGDNETGNGANKRTANDSVFTVIKTFIAEYNPFVYFLT